MPCKSQFIRQGRTYRSCSVLFGSSVLLARNGRSVFFIVGGFVFCPVFSSLVVLLFVPTQHFQKVLSKNIFYRYVFQLIEKMINTYLKNSLKWCVFNGTFGHSAMSFMFCSVTVCLNICQSTNMFFQKWMVFSKFNSSKQVYETFRLKPKLHKFLFHKDSRVHLRNFPEDFTWKFT